MFVVKRTFKYKGEIVYIGTVIDSPETFPMLKNRIGSGDIIILEEGTRNLHSWVGYLKARMTTPLDKRILALIGEAPEPTENIEEEVPEEPLIAAPEPTAIETPHPGTVEAPERSESGLAAAVPTVAPEIKIPAVKVTPVIKVVKK